MQTLLKLDNIKSRMKDASDALREADNWTTLSADVDEVFESGDINAVSAKLEKWKKWKLFLNSNCKSKQKN